MARSLRNAARPLAYALALALGAWSVAVSAKLYFRFNDPAHVPQVVAASPFVAIGLADRSPVAGWSATQRARVVASLRAEPLDVVALRRLALLRDQSPPANSEVAIQRLAERVSRRDLINELALAEFASQGGSVDDTIAHFDRALSVHAEVSRLIFPVLAGALDEPLVRQALVRLPQRAWLPSFLGFAAGGGARGDTVAALLKLPLVGLSDQQRIRAATQLVSRLLKEGNVVGARKAGLELLPGFSSLAQSLALRAAPSGSPMGAWTLDNDSDVIASFSRDGLVAEVSPGRDKIIAQKITFLSPGRYRVSGVVSPSDSSRLSLRLVAACVGQAQPTMNLALYSSGKTAPSAELAVTFDCPAQAWTISGEAADGQMSASAELRSLDLVRE